MPDIGISCNVPPPFCRTGATVSVPVGIGGHIVWAEVNPTANNRVMKPVAKMFRSQNCVFELTNMAILCFIRFWLDPTKPPKKAALN